MSSVAALGTELLCELGALGESAVGVAVCVLGGGLVVGTVRGVTALGCDLLQLVLGKVGEVCGVGGSHFDIRCVEGGVRKAVVKFETGESRVREMVVDRLG